VSLIGRARSTLADMPMAMPITRPLLSSDWSVPICGGATPTPPLIGCMRTLSGAVPAHSQVSTVGMQRTPCRLYRHDPTCNMQHALHSRNRHSCNACCSATVRSCVCIGPVTARMHTLQQTLRYSTVIRRSVRCRSAPVVDSTSRKAAQSSATTVQPWVVPMRCIGTRQCLQT
jgi:hypothetical protein